MKKYGLQIAYVCLLSACLPLLFAWLWLLTPVLEHFVEGTTGYILLTVGLPVFLYWGVVVLLGIANAVHAFRICKMNQEVECVNSMLILKYGLVLFFCINFIALVCWYFAVTLGIMVVTRGTALFLSPVLVPLLIVWIGLAVVGTWLAILPGSFYSMQVLRLAYRQGKLKRGAVILHGLLQFVFLADVLDTMYLSVKLYGRGKRSSIAVAALYVLVMAGIAASFFVIK